MDYRFNPSKGFRRRGFPYGEIDNIEFDSENYDTVDDWFEAIKDYFIEIKEADEEQKG